jgi:sulfur carrier protein
MEIRINGEKRLVANGVKLDALLGDLDISTVGTAVELNREVVPKRTYAETTLGEGDVIEIIRMVGGG